MAEFHIKQELWDALSPEQQKELKVELESHAKVVTKEYEESFSKQREAELSEKIKKELEEANAKNNSLTDFLNSVPESNREVVKDLLEAGKSVEDIKAKHESLFQEPKVAPLNMEEVINGVTEKIKAKDIETDDEFAKRVRENGLGKEATKEDWERVERLKNKIY